MRYLNGRWWRCRCIKQKTNFLIIVIVLSDFPWEYNVTKHSFLRGFLELEKMYIEERAINLAHYIIDSKDTVRGAAKKFGISKSTVHTEVTFQNGRNKLHIIPKSIEIKGVFLAKKNPVVKLGLVIK